MRTTVMLYASFVDHPKSAISRLRLPELDADGCHLQSGGGFVRGCLLQSFWSIDESTS